MAGSPPLASTVQEIDTEVEDNLEEKPEPAQEVEEELSNDAADYSVPEENKDIWKNFGCETEAGRALRRLYAGTKQKDAASRVAYPRLISPARKWQPQAAPQKPCPQRAHVSVPLGRRPSMDRDDPRNWRMPLPGKKPAAEIFAEMEADSRRPARPKLEAGRDQAAEKKNLQEKFRYCGGHAMPSGAMGHVPKGEIPDAAAVRQQLPERWDHIDDTGLTRQQRDIFAGLTYEIQDKQKRIAELDAWDAANPQPSKSKTQHNKEALQLHNDIKRCMADIDRLLNLTE